MKKVKMLTIILMIVLITMVSFFGVYTQYQNRMEEQVKDYTYAMDLKGARNIKLAVSNETHEIIRDANGNKVEVDEELTEEQMQDKGYTKKDEPYNNEELKNVENYKMSKEIIEKRLQAIKVPDYEISLNEENGEILVQIPENNVTDRIVTTLNSTGQFEIIDTQTGEVLMNNEHIKLSNVLYGASQTGEGTSVYLNIEFTKEGTKKLEEISNIYKQVEKTENEEAQEETSEETESKEEEKTITMKIDDEKIMTTSFDEPIKTGTLQLSIGNSATDNETLNEYMAQASDIAQVLDKGKLPLRYNIEENQYIMSDITENHLQYVGIGIAVATLIGIIVLIFRYKASGLFAGIAYVGLSAVYLLIIRYTNVIISIQGIFGIGIVLILNYIFVNKLLSKLKDKTSKSEINAQIKESYKEFFIKIIPICIATIVFCFASWETISSFGMVMFWGILLIGLYNYVITNTMLKIKTDK